MDVKSALQKAIVEDSESCVVRLLQTGVNLKENGFGTELLELAVSKRISKCTIVHLLDNGAEANFGVLKAALNVYDEIIIEKLLNHGANAKETDYLNRNALHKLSASSFDENARKVCEVLIKYGAEVNQQANCLLTPLFFAIGNYSKYKYKVIDVLLQYGAQPLLKYENGEYPLEDIFSKSDRPQDVYKNIIKYTSLQVNHADGACIFDFLSHFNGNKSLNSHSRMYFQFATNCLAEIEILKQLRVVNDSESTLFDFVISQGKILQTFLKNADVVNQIFVMLFTKSIPIYFDPILKKFEHATIIHKISELLHGKWKANCKVKNICLDQYGVEHICRFLQYEDLRNLLIAFISSS